MSFVKKIIALFIFLAILTVVIFYLQPPKSWQEASIFQILAFFLPITFIATLLIDIFVKYLPHSFIFALGVVLALAFYGVNQLNYLTGTLVVLVTLFSWRVFPKMKLPRLRLTRGSKIPKLHMQKQEMPKLRGLRRLK